MSTSQNKTLQNKIEVAFAEGEKCGLARRQKDEARARFHSDWFARYLALQPKDERAQIRAAYDNGYRAVATPSVTYFK